MPTASTHFSIVCPASHCLSDVCLYDFHKKALSDFDETWAVFVLSSSCAGCKIFLPVPRGSYKI